MLKTLKTMPIHVKTPSAEFIILRKLIFHLLFYLSAPVTLLSIEIGFDSRNDLADNFTLIFNSGSVHPLLGDNRYTHIPAGGVANSGAVGFTQVSTEETTAIFNQQSFDFSQPGTALEVSMFVKITPVSGGASGFSAINQNTAIELGFSTENTTGFALQTPGNVFMSIGLVPTATTGDTFSPFVRTGAGSGGSGTQVSPSITLAPDRFYRISGTFYFLGGVYPTDTGNISVTETVSDYGSDGLEQGATVFERTRSDTAFPPLAGDTMVWAGFVSTGANGVAVLDDFHVAMVPEPRTVVLLAIAALPILCHQHYGRISR